METMAMKVLGWYTPISTEVCVNNKVIVKDHKSGKIMAHGHQSTNAKTYCVNIVEEFQKFY
jgi:hypothetical protein